MNKRIKVNGTLYEAVSSLKEATSSRYHGWRVRVLEDSSERFDAEASNGRTLSVYITSYNPGSTFQVSVYCGNRSSSDVISHEQFKGITDVEAILDAIDKAIDDIRAWTDRMDDGSFLELLRSSDTKTSDTFRKIFRNRIEAI